jgi:hypothetical protein
MGVLMRARAFVAVVVGVAVLLGGGAWAPAQAATVSDTPTRSWGVNGRVYAVKIVGGTVYVGGTFSAAVSPSGQQVARRNLAAFRLSDGSLVTGWRADASSSVYALASDGSSLYVGGNFTSLGGQNRQRVARLDLDTGAAVPGFQARATGGPVRALDASGGALYVGGSFTSVNGASRSFLAKLDSSTGATAAGFTGQPNAMVRGLRKSPTASMLYIAGDFTAVSGSGRVGVGGVSSDTGQAAGPALQYTTAKQYSVDVSTDGSQVFSGADSNAVTAWRTSTGTRQWRDFTDGNVQAVRYQSGTLYFGFHDGMDGDTSVKLLAMNAGTGTLDSSFRPTIRPFWGVFGLDSTSTALVAGGEFTSADGVPAQNWARFLP